ncbi:C1 family peptidase [Mesorhizobium sp. B2-4-13]|uniref:C1 family peptidase n=1 Tax=Mesorhizobium sp. B2-4-13 TaxID=2589936 RepID=UPI00115286FC|nr:C1 family peptidase [Mesorhizobium sp. B2-4-13]TPK85712.1 C1 family peptidase [Mesorhizobium sp. B2-4-13]
MTVSPKKISKTSHAPARDAEAKDVGQQSEPAGETTAKLGIKSPVPSNGDVPADAAAQNQDDPKMPIQLGNRTFKQQRKFHNRILNVLPDLPDIRDRIYQPRLRALNPSIYPKIAFTVRNQGSLQSCTGHALAHAIDCLLHREELQSAAKRVSARMLYEMAKRNDEWVGTSYVGSSIRGAVKGFYRNGVCSEALAPDGTEGDWTLTYEMAKEARETRLGAYYRLQPDLSDFHAALDEAGAIYASAQIHEHWANPEKRQTSEGWLGEYQIKPGGESSGGHAFALVGYDAEGFWVLNSWGLDWGHGGIAHWLYEDWAATMMDAWVLQLGVRAPTAFSAFPRSVPSGVAVPNAASAPNRGDIVGHFINIDDGRYVVDGRYASPTPSEMEETVKRIADRNSNKDVGESTGKGYDHLVIYAHGGLNTLDDEANRIAVWKRNDIFARNRIYNFHLMWGSGFIDEAFGPLSQAANGRAGGILGDVLFETIGKPLGARAWRNMKQDAKAAFLPNREDGYGGGLYGLSMLLKGLDTADRRPKLHLVGHSAGAIILGRFLETFKGIGLSKMRLESIHLMAPACTVEFFNQCYGPYLKAGSPLAGKVCMYNLDGQLELDDKVGVASLPSYSHSLLYLVSRAYEDYTNMPIAGMQIYDDFVKSYKTRLSTNYSVNKDSASKSHGGFDNDPATLTTIMSHILGGKVPRPPAASELTGY